MDGMSFVDFNDDANADDGSGLPGRAIPGYPGWRSGVPGSGGLLGVVRVANPGPAQAAPAQGAASDAASSAALPPGYMYDADGKLQLTPQFAQTHPKGPFDFGAMNHNINWPGVVSDLGSLAGNVASSLLLPIPEALDLLLTGAETWNAQDEANRRSQKATAGSTDRATNGLP
jgi:hypothetical protein